MPRVLLFFVAASCAAVAACGESPQAAASCADGDTSVQRRGSACLCCHAGELGAAGSIDPASPKVATITIRDATGRTYATAPNPFGNFFTHERVVLPIRASLIGADGTTVAMKADAPSADCNGCHSVAGGAGPLRAPGNGAP